MLKTPPSSYIHTLQIHSDAHTQAVAAVYFVGLSPFLFAMHGLRRNMAEKHHLLVELKNFDLDKAQTRIFPENGAKEVAGRQL